jgi:tRNA (adenine57-N1/adenine58-N1)-methyltransferase
MSFKEGDWVLLVYEDKRYLRKLDRNFSLNVGKQVVKFEDIEGRRAGEEVKGFYLLEPTLEDIILLGFKRKTQIVYPKDSFYVAFKLGLSKEKKLLEFGVGSGASTAVFSQLAGEVWVYEVREDFYHLAMKNWERFNLCGNVKISLQDFSEAQVEENFFDCAFVDVKEPERFVEKVWKALKPGGVLASILPTTNQVVSMLRATQELFCAHEVVETLHRSYKTNPERLRPQDLMIGHTGYLFFARKRI